MSVENWKMRFSKNLTNYKLISTIAIIVLGVSIPLSIWGGYAWGTFDANKDIPFTPIIDGVIESGWERADIKLAQYLNLPDWDDPENIDAFNYIYMETDDDNLYLAIDMPSDLNGTTDNEFLGVFFNTMEREFDSFASWFGMGFESFRDNGTEALVWDFENNQTVPFIYDADGMKDKYYNYIANTTGQEVEMESGEYYSSGYDDWEFTYYDDTDIVWINSTEFGYGSDIYDRVCLNFSIDLANYFGIYDDPDYMEQLVDDLEDVELNISNFIWALSLSINKVHIENNGTFNDAEITDFEMIFDVNKSAYEDGQLDFSIELAEDTDVHVDNFWYLCDWINLQYNKSDSIDSVYGGTTIEDFELESGFGSSINSETEHRMYEIAIPLSELDNYNSSGKLGLYVCGNIQIDSDDIDFSERQTYQFTGNTEDLYFLWILLNTPRDPNWSDNYQMIDVSKFD